MTDAGDAAEEGFEAGLASETRTLLIGEAQHGMRLDRALVDLVPEFSRSYLQQLIESGAVQLHGKPAVKASAKVRIGDAGTIELRPTLQSQAFKPEPMVLEVVFEDEHLRVINKPAGLVVHPAPGNWSGTLLNGLLARDIQATVLPRAGIVHRLDKDTSGLMVVARTRAAMDALVALIAARDVSRQYLALAHKPWTGPKQRSVELPIGRDPRNRLRMAAVDLAQHAGKAARTDITLLDNVDQGCLVLCALHTGRTHQIRVHMAAIGHALVGDVLYGGAPAAGLTRQALHATRLAFVHPVTGEPLVFHAPLPADLQAALAAWGVSYNA
ncbi:pseudouridine synthase [Rhodoferax koreense]|uniref:Pseudouridine synthase n=1 Tax=Rhodoferax koreensis TaxID=1842727 RepID=A0A1P8JYT1_9BURK|nr:pseudouridine synthase [Rhodoferax koreense]